MRESRLSKYKQERLIELFIAGSTAHISAELVGVFIILFDTTNFPEPIKLIL